ncbi:hypothetical protein H310_10427 [Aphanomyces invadans]|uniref:UDENN domain-containing protein n=1 Tax=Aphanomyces invadans TaxID=157072 RepID=A0A024TQD8_9STRA|nr:hypothetical protein H310_10427 [Aphanomyces invadans]ETV96243.1 hypothetical protein H310_10427 [Aphanomyces invadans]|eukprot:XP_008875035.1 hypothetical protein H310_10427 [Aphanomyces invadans]
MENALADEQDTWRKNYLKEVQVTRSLTRQLQECEERLEAALEHGQDSPETPECSKCLVLERELDVLRARHKSLVAKFKLLEEEFVHARKSPLMQFLSPKRKHSIHPPTSSNAEQPANSVPERKPSLRKSPPTRAEIDEACQSVFRVNNNIPQVLQAAAASSDAELFHHGILFGYPDDYIIDASKDHLHKPHGKDDIEVQSPSSWLGKMLKSPPTSPSQGCVVPRKPAIMSVFPSSASLADVEPMMEFCFPHGNSLRAGSFTNDEDDLCFVVLLSGTQPAQNMYAMCVQTLQRPLRCFCLVSVHPFFSLFFKLLRGVISMCQNHTPQAVQVIFDDALRRLHGTSVPPIGGWCCFRLDPQHPLLTFHRPHTSTSRHEARQFILEFTSPRLFSKVSLDHLLLLLGCLCCEVRVLLLSSNPSLITSCVLALRALLDPFEWAGVVVTLLPPSLVEILEAPVPFLVGQVCSNHQSRRPVPSLVQLNLDTNTLIMDDQELEVLHELKLPRCEALQNELQSYASTCFGNDLLPQSLERHHVEACEHISVCIQSHLATLLDTSTTQHDEDVPFLQRFHSTQMYSNASSESTLLDDDGCGAGGSDLEGETTLYEPTVN